MNVFSQIHDYNDRVAVIDEHENAISFAQLTAEADELYKPFADRPRLVAVRCLNRAAALVAYVGAVRNGHPVLLLSDKAKDDGSIVDVFQPELVFSVASSGQVALRGTGAPPAKLHPDLCVLLSTSGSTGSPKLVKLSKENILENARAIAEYLELTPLDRAITCLPMQYSYGMSVINSHLFCGASVCLSEASVTDLSFWSLFDRSRSTNFQGVPYSFEMLDRTDFVTRLHPSLRFFTQAGGKLNTDIIRKFGEYARDCGARFYVMYGQTEASPRISYIPPEDVIEHADTIGRAIPGGTLRIVNDGSFNNPQEGELVYSGPNIMMGYALARSDLAMSQTISDLHTGDVATTDSKGYFRIVGRASRFLKIFGLRIGLEDIEMRLKAKGIECAATGSDEQVVVAVDQAGNAAAVEAFLAEVVGLPISAFEVIVLSVIPRHENGKVDYRAVMQSAESTIASGTLEDEWRAILGVAKVDPAKSFIEMNGDSLSYVTCSIAVERHLNYLPGDWERIPLTDLATMQPQAAVTSHSVPSDIFVRALMISLVLVHHITQLPLAGSAHALLALAGYNFARFQFPQVLNGNIVDILKNLLINVLLPYYVLLVPVFAGLGGIYWPQYFLFSNFTPGFMSNPLRPTIYWYIESYVVLIGIFSLIIHAFRRPIGRQPVLAIAILFLLAVAVRGYGDQRGDEFPFYMNTAFMLAHVFVFGMAMKVVEDGRQRFAVFIIGGLSFLLLPPSRIDEALPIFLSAVGSAIFLPPIIIGRYLQKAIYEISNSSLYIYMGQSFVLKAFSIAFGGALPVMAYVPAFIACMLFGVAVKHMIDLLTARVSAYRRKRGDVQELSVKAVRQRPGQ